MSRGMTIFLWAIVAGCLSYVAWYYRADIALWLAMPSVQGLMIALITVCAVITPVSLIYLGCLLTNRFADQLDQLDRPVRLTRVQVLNGRGHREFLRDILEKTRKES